MVVLPARTLGHRHEDRLDAPARLEAEDGAAVVDQVELCQRMQPAVRRAFFCRAFFLFPTYCRLALGAFRF